MALIDDIEFYGRAVDAGEMDRQQAVRLLTEASNGRLGERGAAEYVDNWHGARRHFESVLFDVDDMLRALRSGCPAELVAQRAREVMRAAAKASALRMIRREPDTD